MELAELFRIALCDERNFDPSRTISQAVPTNNPVITLKIAEDISRQRGSLDAKTSRAISDGRASNDVGMGSTARFGGKPPHIALGRDSCSPSSGLLFYCDTNSYPRRRAQSRSISCSHGGRVAFFGCERLEGIRPVKCKKTAAECL